MPAPCSFEYAIIRVVPRVEREEFINVGAIVFSADRDFLAARVDLDVARLLALAPEVDLPLLDRHLSAIATICRGGAAAGPIGELPVRERWQWLTSPRSTVLQTSPPHPGLGDDPAVALERLVDEMVRVRPSARVRS